MEPKIILKHQRGTEGFDANLPSLSAKRLTTGDIAAHLAEIHSEDVSHRGLVSAVTDRIVDGMGDGVVADPATGSAYPAVSIDAVMLNIRACTVGNRLIYVAGIFGRTRDVESLWDEPSASEAAAHPSQPSDAPMFAIRPGTSASSWLREQVTRRQDLIAACDAQTRTQPLRRRG